MVPAEKMPSIISQATVPAAAVGVQTHFSFHWGAASPEKWLNAAERLGYRYLAFTDHASLHALPEIFRLTQKSRVKPVYGVLFPFTSGGCVFVLIETAEGYANLCQTTSSWLKAVRRSPPQNRESLPVLSEPVGVAVLAGALPPDGVATLAVMHVETV